MIVEFKRKGLDAQVAIKDYQDLDAEEFALSSIGIMHALLENMLRSNFFEMFENGTNVGLTAEEFKNQLTNIVPNINNFIAYTDKGNVIESKK